MTKNDKPFEITGVCKDDIIWKFKDNEGALKIIDKMRDKDMQYLAKKMGDYYSTQQFWNSLEIIFTEIFLNK